MSLIGLTLVADYGSLPLPEKIEVDIKISKADMPEYVGQPSLTIPLQITDARIRYDVTRHPTLRSTETVIDGHKIQLPNGRVKSIIEETRPETAWLSMEYCQQHFQLPDDATPWNFDRLFNFTISMTGVDRFLNDFPYLE